MDNVKICIVGIGNMGSIHANALYEGKVKGATLSAVCDIKEDKLGSCNDYK